MGRKVNIENEHQHEHSFPMSLINHFQQIRDYRTQPVYPLWVILVLVVMGTMSGCHGYRPLAAFVSRHQPVLLELMELPHSRLPSLSTLRRIMVRLDFNQLSDAFNAWAMESCGNDFKGQLATDGKSIKASLSDYDKSYQDFVSLVSLFSVEQGQVVALSPMRNGQTSEITVVRDLLERLELSGACISLDALHTKKNG